ncbi:MAG: hypothetical protein H0V89_01320, partial [Deltaproteobacteria bacterium]|nr:hypothetical protein [Deltaproteobacteria bacterium]
TYSPYLVLYIGSAEWEPGDWGDSDNLCVAIVDISGSVAGGDWVAENGLWFGFETPASAPVLDTDCDDMTDAGYDPYTYFGADFVWSIGIGPLVAPYITYYEGDTTWVGGYTSVSVDPTPIEAEALAAVAYANSVDPANMYYDYDTDLDAAAIPLAEGGIVAGYYHVISYHIIELP